MVFIKARSCIVVYGIRYEYSTMLIKKKVKNYGKGVILVV